MGSGTPEKRGIVNSSPEARKIRIEVLNQSIADSQHLIEILEAEKARLLARLSQIPDSIATVKEWMEGDIQELDILEGHRLNNGHSIPSQIPSLTSAHRP